MKTRFSNQLAVYLTGCLTILAFAPPTHAASTLHVWQGSPNPTAPYTNWTTAAHVIQDAVDRALDGDTVERCEAIDRN